MSLEVRGDLRREGDAELLKLALPDPKNSREGLFGGRVSACHLA
jgi:hypothetical protein